MEEILTLTIVKILTFKSPWLKKKIISDNFVLVSGVDLRQCAVNAVLIHWTVLIHIRKYKQKNGFSAGVLVKARQTRQIIFIKL